MQHETLVFSGVEELASAAAAYVALYAQRSVVAQGSFHFAVSGGRTPWRMFTELRRCEMPWAQTVLYQVDERVVGPNDPDRNLRRLMEVLVNVDVQVRAMPVDDDLDAGARLYEELLPERFDLVHLGLGVDGHTASLVPDDPVLAVTDRLVAVTAVYESCRRMTLTYPALARADQLLWLVDGKDKCPALALLNSRDISIPAGRVEAQRSLIMTDQLVSGS